MKYKLIKLLPFENSPKIDYISEPHCTQKDGAHYWNHNWFNPENYPEFWEKVVEKDYLITGYYQNLNNIHINITGNFSKSFETEYLIYQVKRLSDGEIFTIGDDVIFELGKGRCHYTHFRSEKCTINIATKIVSFVIQEDTLTVQIDYNKLYYSLDAPEKAKQPLFTTEDGVDIFAGMSFYYVCEELELYNTICCTDEKKYKNAKQFSTREKAEEYILMNKPVLSLKDIEKLLCKNTSSYFLEKFKKLVKSKYNSPCKL